MMTVDYAAQAMLLPVTFAVTAAAVGCLSGALSLELLLLMLLLPLHQSRLAVQLPPAAGFVSIGGFAVRILQSLLVLLLLLLLLLLSASAAAAAAAVSEHQHCCTAHWQCAVS
jgi:hypothetical protein